MRGQSIGRFDTILIFRCLVVAPRRENTLVTSSTRDATGLDFKLDCYRCSSDQTSFILSFYRFQDIQVELIVLIPALLLIDIPLYCDLTPTGPRIG